MTDADRKRLEAIKARCEAATEGPWQHEHRRKDDGMYRTEVFDMTGEAIACLAWHPVQHPGGTSTDRAENAAFIAHARADIPWLISLLEALDGLA